MLTIIPEHIAFLLLGGNLGDMKTSLTRALEMISARAGRVHTASSLYKTEPWGFQSELPFLNQAIQLVTQLSPQTLLKTLLEIEKEMGRTRSINNYESRVIDIDILFYDSLIILSPELEVPHPRMHLRNFALHPMCEIAPGFVHPVLGKTMVQLRDECPDDGDVYRLHEKFDNQEY